MTHCVPRVKEMRPGSGVLYHSKPGCEVYLCKQDNNNNDIEGYECAFKPRRSVPRVGLSPSRSSPGLPVCPNQSAVIQVRLQSGWVLVLWFTQWKVSSEPDPQTTAWSGPHAPHSALLVTQTGETGRERVWDRQTGKKQTSLLNSVLTCSSVQISDIKFS